MDLRIRSWLFEVKEMREIREPIAQLEEVESRERDCNREVEVERERIRRDQISRERELLECRVSN